MDNRTVSYTAANAVPYKIFKNRALTDNLYKGKIIPIHIQLNPTNRCNLNCNFCSCKNRDEKLELDFGEVKELAKALNRLGTQAVTVTGGGEPLMYPDINGLISYFSSNAMRVGLVTNGYLLRRLSFRTLTYLTWSRISCSDEIEFNKKQKYEITQALIKGPSIDWAFSYVLSSKPNVESIASYVEFANRNDFTHIRIVSDLIDLDNMYEMAALEGELVQAGIDNSKVIFQGRKLYTKGQEDCYISLLKPNIGADGDIYPCCGVQYALEDPSLDYEKSMRMGHMRDIEKIYRKQKWFNGSVCKKCYYGNYNDALSAMMRETQHKEFV